MRTDAASQGLLTSRLQDLHASSGTWKGVARALGVSLSYLSDVVHGRREAGDAILRPLGLERVITYKERSIEKSRGKTLMEVFADENRGGT